jgi:hypothetical protein
MRSALALTVFVVLAGCKASPPPPAPPLVHVVEPSVDERDARFWQWFEANAARLAALDPDAVVAEVGAALQKEHPGVIAELAIDKDARTLVLSADGDKKVFPQVKRLFAARPTIAGWDVIAFRPPANPDEPMAELAANGISLDPAAVRFVVLSTGDTIDIAVFIPGYVATDQTFMMLGFLALDHTIGEYAMETRIGGISWHPLTDAPATAQPLLALQALVTAK